MINMNKPEEKKVNSLKIAKFLHVIIWIDLIFIIFYLVNTIELCFINTIQIYLLAFCLVSGLFFSAHAFFERDSNHEPVILFGMNLFVLIIIVVYYIFIIAPAIKALPYSVIS